MQVTLEVEKQLITIDTGTAVSLMSEEEHHRRWPA